MSKRKAKPQRDPLALQRALNQAQTKPQAVPRFAPPDLMPGVVPEGRTAAIAMDYAPGVYEYASFIMPNTFVPFPGYPYLANLSTRTEYRAFASTMATEVTREWIEFGTVDGGDNPRIAELEKALDEFNVRRVIATMATHDSLYGRGQCAVKFRNDTDETLQTPLVLDKRTIARKSLKAFAPVEPLWTTPSAYNALDPTAPDFYKPRAWFMLGKEIHASRMLTVITRPLPDILKPAYNFSGMSLSQLAEPYVNNWLRTRQSVSDLINNFSITALATAMDQVLQGNDDGVDVFKRAELFTATRSNQGLMLLDADRERIEQHNVPLSGLHELQAQSLEHLCTSTRIPAMILTGISPSGLNASSDGEIRVFYDWIKSQQEAHYSPVLDDMIAIVQLHLWGEIDDSITWHWRPLWQTSELELADIRLKEAQAADTYVNMGALSPEDVRTKLARDADSGWEGIDELALPEPPMDPMDPFGEDKSVSEAQHRAMAAAAEGHSTLGIPKSVGEEFIRADKEA